MMKRTKLFCVAVWALAGCTSPQEPSARIAVAEGNSLGVVAIELDTFDENGDTVSELRGLDAADGEVASVKLHTGKIADLPDYLPGADTLGSELILTVHGDANRILSRELDVHQLAPVSDPDMQAFLELSTVTSALRHEMNVDVSPRPAQGQERALAMTVACPASYMLTTPVAAQCCYSDPYDVGQGYNHTKFVNPTNAIVTRFGPATPCRAQNGGSCSGASCYYGPNGFSRPQLEAGGSKILRIHSYYSWDPIEVYECRGAMYTSNPYAIEFGNVTGTFPSSQGCPGGTTGAGQWDY